VARRRIGMKRTELAGAGGREWRRPWPVWVAGRSRYEDLENFLVLSFWKACDRFCIFGMENTQIA